MQGATHTPTGEFRGASVEEWKLTESVNEQVTSLNETQSRSYEGKIYL